MNDTFRNIFKIGKFNNTKFSLAKVFAKVGDQNQKSL